MQKQLNERQIISFLLVTAGVFFACLIVYFIVSSRGNIVGNVFKFFLPMAFLLGLIIPRLAFFVLIICAGYIDILKRFMVFDASMAYTDLYFILGIPPMILFGITSSILISYLLRWRKVEEGDLSVIFFSLFLTIGFVLIGVLNNASIKTIVNNAGYSLLGIVVPILFQNRKNLVGIFRFIIITFIPVALYGLKQSYLGLSEFEIRYTMSGFTIVNEVLWDAAVRPFSTLASEGQLSFAMSYCALLAFSLPIINAYRGRKNTVSNITYFSLFILFIYTGILSLNRMNVVIWILSLGILFFLTTRFKTILLYLAIFLGFAFTVFFGQQTLTFIHKNTKELSQGSVTAGMLLRTGTFTTRLNSFKMLADPSTYTLTGIPKDQRTDHQRHIHTWWASYLIDYGILSLVPFIIIGPIFMYHLHSYGWKAPPGEWKFIYVFLTSLIVATFVITALGSPAIYAFPTNFFTYLSIAGLFLLKYKDPWQEPPAEEDSPSRNDVENGLAHHQLSNTGGFHN